jgi:hypothetical protein
MGAFAFAPTPTLAQEVQEVIVERSVVAADGLPPTDHVQVFIAGPDGNMTFFSPTGKLGTIVLPNGKILNMGGGPGGMQIRDGQGRLRNVEFIDPARSYVRPLTKRNDVRSEILMSARQREQLETLEKTSQTEMQKKLDSHFGKGEERIQLQDGGSREEMLNRVKERVRQSRELIQKLQADRDKQLEEVLSPKQTRRLKELDVQWRGPLSLSVEAVAEAVGVETEQRQKIEALLQEYRQEIAKQMNFGNSVRVISNARAGEPAKTVEKPNEKAQAMPKTPEEWQAHWDKAYREVEKARKALGKKALDLLTPEQKQRWAELQGATFAFCQND